MTILDAISLFIIMLTLAAIPSASVALVVTRSAALGFANGVAVSIGIVLGDLIFVLLAVLGLTTLSQLMGIFFSVVKYIAAAYLVWFGITLLTSKTSISIYANNNRINRNDGLIISFITGLLLTLGDIKAIFFYASLFPIFVDMSALRVADIFTIMLVTIIAVGGVKLAYAFGARELLSMSKGMQIERKTKLVAGSVLVGVGAYLAAKT